MDGAAHDGTANYSAGRVVSRPAVHSIALTVTVFEWLVVWHGIRRTNEKNENKRSKSHPVRLKGGHSRGIPDEKSFVKSYQDYSELFEDRSLIVSYFNG